MESEAHGRQPYGNFQPISVAQHVMAPSTHGLYAVCRPLTASVGWGRPARRVVGRPPFPVCSLRRHQLDKATRDMATESVFTHQRQYRLQ